MGRMVLACLRDTAGAEIAGGTDAPGAEALGQDLGELAGFGALGLVAGDDPVALFAQCEAVIDFTTPSASLAHASAGWPAICKLGSERSDPPNSKSCSASPSRVWRNSSQASSSPAL